MKRAIVVTVTLSLASIAVSIWFGWTLATVHVCEKHDSCEDAPAFIRDGLAELQAKDPVTWCPPAPATCKRGAK